MSDYVKNKVVRYLPTENDLKLWGIARRKDLYEEIEEKKPELFSYSVRRKAEQNGLPYFEASYGYNDKTESCNYYIDYVLDHDYGGGCSEWGKTRKLYPQELIKYGKIFEALYGDGVHGPDLNNFRLVEYCYYNGCDAPDFFDEVADPFFDEV